MSKKKEYPLEVEGLADYGGDPSCYYSKGHHDFVKFAEIVNFEFDDDEVAVNVAKCRHRWCRWMPDPYREFNVIARFYDEPGRGRFPVTVYYL